METCRHDTELIIWGNLGVKKLGAFCVTKSFVEEQN